MATIMAAAIRMPGTKPARKSLLTETPVSAPYRTNGMLGGMTGPMAAALATMAAEKLGLKPLSTIALCSTWPRPAASAMADPDIPEKMTLAITHTCPSPPGTCPIIALAKRKMRLVMPPVFMRLPARMKNGMASRVKLVVEAYIRCGSMVSRELLPSPTNEMIAVSAMATAMGRSIRINTKSRAKMSSVNMA